MKKHVWRPVMRRRRCSTCGRTLRLTAFKKDDDGLRPCRRCVRQAKDAATAAAKAAVQPTLTPNVFDLLLGHESADPGHRLGRERIVRVQRVDGVVRIVSAVRLDAATIHPLTSLTVPIRKVGELQTALASLVTDRA